MTLEAIETTRLIAMEFVARAEALSTRIRIPDDWGMRHDADDFPKEHAALRRQSMELTRALADLRRS